MEYIIKKKNDELMHHGIKGMRWGVRRYQNKDGSLTPAGKKRSLQQDYKNAGASKDLQRRHGYDQLINSRLSTKVDRAIRRLQDNDANYSNKKRAKDYDTAIRALSSLRDREITQTYDDQRVSEWNNRKMSRLERKNATNKRERKIQELITDEELMELRTSEAVKRYKKYDTAVNQLIEKMKNDKSVVYTTRRRTHANSQQFNSQYLSISNTDYKVRSKTKSRAKSKKYNDPNSKKQYSDQLTKTTIYYY